VEPAIKVVTELRRQGYQGRMIGSLLFADPDLAPKVGAMGNGTLYATWFYSGANERSKSFTDKFNAATKAMGLIKAGPHHVDASAYDIVGLLAKAIGEAKLTGDPSKVVEERDQLRDALEKTSYVGAVGAMRFTPDHDAILPIYVMEVKNGSVSLVAEKKPAP
jgi:branched-chain amino acid transport system substrate-binding protein